jgi:hypothetical protein
MHTIELFEHLAAVAQRLGYEIRHEYLGGVGGGRCEVGGKKWIFIDLALNSDEQLDQIVEAIQEDPAIFTVSLPEGVSQLLGRAA